MSSQQDALDHLRVIRSLMEKAHIYRSISAPAALVGGGLAVALALAGNKVADILNCTIWDGFLISWLAVLAITSALNVFLLSREARLRGQPLVSEGMRMALRAILPPLLVGGVIGIGLILYLHHLALGALIWIVCYGLALLATASFSPRSLLRLGWLFVITGLIFFWGLAARGHLELLPSDLRIASFVMGFSFGLLHICYGAAVLLRKKPAPISAE